MRSQSYRYYRLDGSGQLHGAEWFDAASDHDAIERVQGKHPESRCEIWERHRLVATIAPAGVPA